MDPRQERGLVIAATSRITQKGKVWLVPSQSGTGTKYTVIPDEQSPHCTCPDHETRGCECKHIHAVRFVIQREQNEDGSVTETRTLTVQQKRTTYAQDWTSYNRAQTTEKATFQVLLANLCKGIEEPPAKIGRPRFPLQDAIFAACFKVYSTVSGRRFMTDMREAQDEGYVNRAPSYNLIFKILEQPETFDILRRLVAVSAAPLKSLETNFACDSSGFSGCRFDRWFEHKYGSPMKKVMRAWVKCHLMCGVKTNVVTAVEIHDQFTSDSPQLQPLLETTAKTFTVNEVSADLGYSSRNNLAVIEQRGAFPLIPFKHNATPAAGGLWAKMFNYFQFHRDEFLARYHQRSNVESTFSMIKRKFGDSVRSKCDVAMKNEVLAKIVCHNIVCLIHEMHESGVDPTFWAESRVAHNLSTN